MATTLAVPGVLWARRHQTLTPTGPGQSTFLTVLPVLGFVAGCEAILSNNDFVSGCSSGCQTYPLAMESRAVAAALVIAALLGARRMVRNAQLGGGILRALGTMGLALAVVFALLGSYTAYSTSLQDSFRWGWLGWHLAELPADRQKLGDALVEVKSDLLGRVLLTHLADGHVTRWRLSTGPFRTQDSDDLVRRVHAQAVSSARWEKEETDLQRIKDLIARCPRRRR